MARQERVIGMSAEMTMEQFEAWLRDSDKYIGRWTIDKVHNGMGEHDMIVYKGSLFCGCYISIAQLLPDAGADTTAIVGVGEYRDSYATTIASATFICKANFKVTPAQHLAVLRSVIALLSE